MPQNPSVAADPVEVRCASCRKLTNHTQVAADPAAPQLQCSVCNRQRKLPVAAKTQKPAPRRTIDPAAEERKEWAALAPEMRDSAATNYSMTSACKLKSLVKHPQFGLGLVQRVIGPQKVEILFADGKKTMRCK